MAGRKKKYTPLGLQKAVDRYFDSISRVRILTERVPTGEKDDKGHVIFEEKEIINNLNEPMTVNEFIIPPTVGGLCDALGIHRSTWAEYCDEEKNPQFSDTTTRARGRMRAYLEQALLTRKDVKGIIFDLQNNYGYTDKKEVELGSKAQKILGAATLPPEEREELLSALIEEARRDDPASAD